MRHSSVKGSFVGLGNLTAMDGDQLLTEQEAADFLSLSTSYLRLLRSRGTLPGRTKAIPFVRCGRAIRYRCGDLREWVASQRICR